MGNKTDILKWYEFVPGRIHLNFSDNGFFSINIDDFLLWLIDKKIIEWREAYPKWSKKLKDIFKPRNVKGESNWYAGIDNTKKLITLLNKYYIENGNNRIGL